MRRTPLCRRIAAARKVEKTMPPSRSACWARSRKMSLEYILVGLVAAHDPPDGLQEKRQADGLDEDGVALEPGALHPGIVRPERRQQDHPAVARPLVGPEALAQGSGPVSRELEIGQQQ